MKDILYKCTRCGKLGIASLAEFEKADIGLCDECHRFLMAKPYYRVLYGATVLAEGWVEG